MIHRLYQDTLKSLFKYDPKTGELFSKKTKKRLGGEGLKRGRKVRFLGRKTPIARVAWTIYYGKDPGDCNVLHINGDHTDDCIENLRIAK